MNTMKTIFAGLLLAASTNVFAGERDDICMIIGRIAQATAEAMHNGASEEAAVARAEENSNAMVRRDTVSIVRYVYTMRFEPTVARQMVYLKCVGGEYFK